MWTYLLNQPVARVGGLAADHLAEGVVVNAVLLGESPKLGVRPAMKGPADLRDDVHGDRSVPDMVQVSTPHLVRYNRYALGMKKPKAALILRDNVVRLLQHHDKLPADSKGIQALRRRGLSMGSAQRVLGATEHSHTSLGIDFLDEIAAAFGLRAYQLLVPGLDPAAPVRLPETPQERRIALAIRIALEAEKTIPNDEHQDEPSERRDSGRRARGELPRGRAPLDGHTRRGK